ncbi:MAG: DNA-processing protein DprA [Brevinematales bacterium]|nr:DNA-processing protein DprA [Brevinematales bacterium]
MDLIYKLALSYNEYIGPKRYKEIKNYGLNDFFSLNYQEQMQFLKIKTEKAIPFFKNMLIEAEKIEKICKKESIKVIEIESETYPPLLREIEDAPFLIYMLGDFNYSIKPLAVVGTRNPTEDAKLINEYFTREIVSYGIGIVSGLAKGHDGIAQKIAIENDGWTVAVVGGGVDVIYPLSNASLYHQIKKKGCIISEYTPGTYPLKQNFPLRNRIISGLSCGVFVIQAPEKSGSLITAQYAELQGRELYTIPGNVIDPSYSGNNHLIQRGAKIVVSPEEIVFDILGKKAQKIINKKEEHLLSQEEKQLLSLINKEAHFDEIVIKSKMLPERLNHILTLLELKGYLEECAGGFYRRL